MEFVGREEIDEVEEDSTETGRQTVHYSRPEKTSVDRRRDRSTGQSTGVHDMHRFNPVDRPVDRGMGWSTGRSTNRRVLTFLLGFGFLFWMGSIQSGFP